MSASIAGRVSDRPPVPPARAAAGRGGLRAAPAAGLRLLGEVLARLPGVQCPVVQVVCAAPGTGPGPVGRDLAAAAAISLGRTLIASPHGQESAEEAAARGLSWLMTGLAGGEAGGIVPDMSVPGLYHTGLATQQPGPLEVPVDAWLAAPQQFRMIVIESPAVAADPRTLAVAARCDGSVLAVAAGETTLADMRACMRQLTGIGARLLGSVLHDAPAFGLPGSRRRSA